jgi:hypothetical protein
MEALFSRKSSCQKDSARKYALLIGRGASERINLDKSITGLPYLHGYMLDRQKTDGNINTYLTGQKLRGAAYVTVEWVTMYGIFKIPKGTDSAKIFLSQAERRGDPQNGSAAKFDNIT